MNKKFIIIDHSLADLKGHYFECSVSVATSAQKQGYEAIIVTNKNFSPDLYPENITIIPEFEVDWLNNNTQKLNATQQAFKNFNDKLNSFNLELVINDYQQKIDYYIFKLKLTKPKAKLFLEKVEGSTSRLTNWIKKDVNLIQYIPLTNTLWGLLKIIWGLIRFPFSLIFKNLLKIWLKIFTFKSKTFSESFKEILGQIAPNINDHIFIHTLSIEQLEDILNILLHENQENLSQYHIMMRRDIDDYLVKNAEGIGIRACLNKFYESKLFPNKVKFYADSFQLVERYNSLSPVQFLEITVPFRQEKIEINSSLKNKQKEQDNQAIHLIYLGDARTEKGYLYLPQIVEDLWDEYLAEKKVKITIQSNFNISQGETGILGSRLKLEQYPEDRVKIIKEPINTEEYYQLLVSADLVIISYDINSYRYRTSGILTESLAAGKPVIVPAKSWLATQVDEKRAGIYQQPQDISKTIIKVINNLDEYQKNAEQFSTNWRLKHSPDNLIKLLLSNTNFNLQSTEKSVNKELIITSNQILFFINAKTLLDLTTESQIIFSHLQYFSDLKLKLVLIFYWLDTQYPKQINNDVTFKIESLISNYNIVKTWYLFEVNDYPQFLSNLDVNQYLQDVYENKASFTRDLIHLNSLLIPTSLTNYLQGQNIDLIILDAIDSQILVNNLPLSNIPIICQLSKFQSYQYALVNNQEINQQEWQKENELFSQINLTFNFNQYLGDKLKNLHENLLTYTLPDCYKILDFNPIVIKNNILEILWGKQQYKYEKIINDSLNLLIKNPNFSQHINYQKTKIAMLYPWGDIFDRKAGSSQRVGLLLDYLKSQDYSIWFFTLGAEKEFLIEKTRYNFYEQNFEQLDLVKQVYTESYNNLINAQQLSTSEDKNIENYVEDWRLNMYYQFRFDQQFYQWIEKVVNWADIVFLEYPFWAKTVGEICQKKQVKLVITTHDIIHEQVENDTAIQKILLAEEISSLQMANQVICVSEEDQKLLKNNNINSTVIPNPVKFNSIQEEKIKDSLSLYINDYPWLTEKYCLFVGSQHYPNLEAVKNIEKIAQKYQESEYKPECKFIIVGSCCERKNENNFIALGKIELEFLQLIYHQANLILAPMLSGTGSSLKVMEAMSYGKVILGTKIAFRGYPIISEKQAIICNILDEYSLIINDLLSNTEQLKKISKEAQELAKKYEYREVYQNYLTIINDLI